MDKFGIIDVDQIDLSKISIGPFRGMPTGPDRSETSSMKTARILYDNAPLKVRLRKMPTSWGLSAPIGDKPGQPYRLELSMGHNPEGTGIYRLCKFIDEAIRKNAEENPKDYLNKRNFSPDLFEERYKSPMLRFSRDRVTGEIKDYPPFIRMNVNQSPSGDFLVDGGFFGSDRKPIVVNTSNASQMVSRRDECRAVVLVDKIWANQLGFGCKLKLLQLRVYKTALRLGDVDMTGGDDEEDFDAAAAEEFDDPELAHASMSIQGMKAAPLGM